MTETYSAQIVNGVVVQVIVGNAQWATERIGGLWVDSETLVGIDWTWTEENGFQRPELPVEE